MRSITWDEMEKLLTHCTADQVANLHRPRGEPQVVTFTGGDKLSLNVRCKKKGFPRFAIDGLSSVPPRVEELGTSFETQ